MRRPETIRNASRSAVASAPGSAPSRSAATSRSSVLEIVTPADSAWSRARLAIGSTAPRLRSIVAGAPAQARARRQRHRDVGCGPREAAQEVGVRGRVADHGHERRDHGQPARDVAEVERDGGPDEARAVGMLEALAQHRDPALVGHAPARIAGEHVAMVGAEPAGGEPGVDVGGEGLEVGVGLRPAAGGIGERVVLVGRQRHLPPRDAAECEPGPRRRGGAVALEREVEQARGRGVALRAEHARDRAGVEPGVDERHEHVRQPRPGRLGQRGLVRRARELVLQHERVVLGPEQLLGRDQAQRRAVRVQHAHLAHARLEHGHQRLAGQLVGAQRQHGRAQRGAQRRLRSLPGGEDPRPQVGVVDHAEAVGGLHERRAHAGLAHPPRGLADRRARVHRQRRLRDQRGQPGRAQLGQAVSHVARAHHPLAQGRRHEARARPDGRARAARGHAAGPRRRSARGRGR